MSPVLQTPITLTRSILLRRLLLRQMPLAIRHDATHMVDVFVRVLRRLFGGIVLENRHDFATAKC